MRYNRYLMIGIILLTSLILLLTAEVFTAQPVMGYIASRSMNVVTTSYSSIIIGIVLPLAAGVLYIIAKQKKN